MSFSQRGRNWKCMLMSAPRSWRTCNWYAFCQALYKGIEGEDWEDVCDSDKEKSRAVGVRNLLEAQKAKALCAMEAAKDRKEEFCDPAREEDISRRNK